jgi:hypothetical protein
MFGRMRRLVALALLLVGSAVCEGQPVHAQQFSADLVSRSASGESVGAPGKLYVAGQKVRIETPDLPGGFFVVDSAVPSAYLVRPAQRVFMDAKQSSRIIRLLVPLNSADPCPQWRSMAELAGLPDSDQWRCNDEGRDNVDGRDTVRFRVLTPQGYSIGWIDLQLRFPLKVQTDDGTVIALQHITEAPQPASEFEIPADYKKFDPRQVIELLKRTDIWVEPPR